MAGAPDTPESTMKSAASQPDSVRALVETVGQSAAIPHFYFNGMIIAQGTADITLILQLNNQPVAALNCSFTIAKTLAQGLNDGIKTLERLAGREIMTVDYIARSVSKMRDTDGKSNP